MSNKKPEAIRLATESVDLGGGPFGAVVVRDGQIDRRLPIQRLEVPEAQKPFRRWEEKADRVEY